jgi:nitric oxide reductase NorD protein
MNDPVAGAIELLKTADPELAAAVAVRLAHASPLTTVEEISWLVEQALWALGEEVAFGRAVGQGCAELVGAADREARRKYTERVREALRTGPTLGRIMAESLPPVLAHGDVETLERFTLAWDVMCRKGSYTLREPLLALGPVLAAGDRASAAAYLDLLRAVFDSGADYAECRNFAAVLPKALLGLDPRRRRFQIGELLELARVDRRLIEPFLGGMAKGLRLLREDALRQFVQHAAATYRRHPDAAGRALALESENAREQLGRLQVSVGCGQVQDRLRRYLHARTGLGLAVRPLSELPAGRAASSGHGRMVCSDSAAIYLPDEIDRFDCRDENERLYRLLVRLEASLHEFGTFDFELEKALALCPAGWGRRAAVPPDSEEPDIERFLSRFPDPGLAADVFTIFELGRIRLCLADGYPGLVRRWYPLLQAVFREEREGAGADPLGDLFARVALGIENAPAGEAEAEIATAFAREVSAASPVEAAAGLAARYCAAFTGRAGGLSPPFGWRPWPNPAAAGDVALERAAGRLAEVLARRGMRAGRSELRRRLRDGGGRLTPRDLQELGRSDDSVITELARAGGGAETDRPGPDADRDGAGVVYRYPEWDDRLGDYLPEHVRLSVRPPLASGLDGFYADVLRRRRVLVDRTRQAFERMRPEGVERLRRWVDGDEFDYRELIEAAVDRRLGDMPSDRVFIKRVKHRRDVAVLLLVDVSRSTAHPVPGSECSVLDVEKESIVVLCEALTVLGDSFAVAAFSGTGRLGVDYFGIKGFDEPLSPAVKRRFGALQPQRNTRLGAAIRHAGRELDAVPARVRLLVILSDGFPNDTGYKGPYAVADTRRALLELQGRHIRFHALTVNLPADAQLDALYGKARHHVIADVQELPGRLLTVYSALTR